MRVLVDTSIWSAALRKSDKNEEPLREAFGRLIRNGLVEIIGPVRQELLSGIKEHAQYLKLRKHLGSWVDLPVETSDYEEAAAYYNLCRAKGIQGSGTDLLICALALRHDLSIFTSDKDFDSYAKALPIRLHKVQAG